MKGIGSSAEYVSWYLLIVLAKRSLLEFIRMNFKPHCMPLRSVLLWIIVTCVASCVLAQTHRSLRIVSWNVENLFDTLDDVGFRDEEFLPEGERHWNGRRYWRKLNDVARVVAAMSDSCGVPDLIGLCEVENDSVLTTLTTRSQLRHLGYEFVITHSSDVRGIDVALLYQPSRFRLLDHYNINVRARGTQTPTTRDILYVKGLVSTSQGPDTLHVIVVHLPSKVSGRTGDKLRRQAAATLWAVTDSIMMSSQSFSRAGSQPRIVVIGDFNASARNRIFRRCPLIVADDTSAPGTYCFQGFWQWIDHVLHSSSVKPFNPARPFSMPWLLEENKTYGGQMPRRTFRGSFYHGGVSDHLPVVFDISL